MLLNMQKKQMVGFTLIELLIAIAIIGILAAIAIPTYQMYTRRAHYSEIVQAAAPYKLGVEECFQLVGILDDCYAGQYGIPANIDEEHSAGLVGTVQVQSGGIITVTPKNQNGITTNDNYILTPTESHGALVWAVSGVGVTAGYAN